MEDGRLTYEQLLAAVELLRRAAADSPLFVPVDVDAAGWVRRRARRRYARFMELGRRAEPKAED